MFLKQTNKIKTSVCYSGKDDIIDWDENQLDKVTNQSHDEESHNTCLQDLFILLLVWLLTLIVKDD